MDSDHDQELAARVVAGPLTAWRGQRARAAKDLPHVLRSYYLAANGRGSFARNRSLTICESPYRPSPSSSVRRRSRTAASLPVCTARPCPHWRQDLVDLHVDPPVSLVCFSPRPSTIASRHRRSRRDFDTCCAICRLSCRRRQPRQLRRLDRRHGASDRAFAAAMSAPNSSATTQLAAVRLAPAASNVGNRPPSRPPRSGSRHCQALCRPSNRFRFTSGSSGKLPRPSSRNA